MDRRPQIDYPCDWSFRLIGESEHQIRALVVRILGDLEHTLERSRASSAGRYTSLKLSFVARDDSHRTSLHAALSAHQAIRFVL